MVCLPAKWEMGGLAIPFGDTSYVNIVHKLAKYDVFEMVHWFVTFNMSTPRERRFISTTQSQECQAKTLKQATIKKHISC